MTLPHSTWAMMVRAAAEDPPWSFRVIPPDALTSPSYAESVEIGVNNPIGWITADPKPARRDGNVAAAVRPGPG